MLNLKTLETSAKGTKLPLDTLLDSLPFDAQGLVPAIAQDAVTREVLMLAWMNRDAIDQTLASGRVTYFSRSRQRLWVKGETSGHVQHLRSMRIDCDGDALLLEVEQHGPACHTLRETCFYLQVTGDSVEIISEPTLPSQPSGQ
ncbi:MAG TPA: phosphoribosyl-AMP cyclohydrolase [Gammaproteobacteria bacterium]|jgi:phosphoribosyl-AMP cyclohydrolase|nr:phosphoribosyl-AMP cyclohydrolase [Gammaproteobacteria bacterium]